MLASYSDVFHMFLYLTQWQHCRDVAVTRLGNAAICDVDVSIALSSIPVVLMIRELWTHSLRNIN
jgi:hypothetical protein